MFGRAFSDAEAIASKASALELSGDFDEAFQLYLKAAQAFLQLSRAASTDREKAKSKSAGSRAIGRAEIIKKTKGNLKPIPADPFSKDEQYYILERSSRINSLRFPLWQFPTQSDWEGLDPFIDPDGPIPLTPLQESRIGSYSRPMGAIMTSDLVPEDIAQNSLTNCSVIASLSVCLEHHARFGSKLAISSLYPQDSTRLPKVSPSGKYICRFAINGTSPLDDLIPISLDGELLCASTGSKIVLWPILLEKAYMKVMGGYDFPGSNSSVDLHVLTGWIPEQISIHSGTFEREKMWNRIIDGFSKGTCLVTLGTGSNPPLTPEFPYLIPCHNYPVIAIKDDSERIANVINPWRRTGSANPLVEGTPAVVPISWDAICNTFDTVYLNWTPDLFEYSLVHHGSWKPDVSNSIRSHSCSNQHLRLRLSPTQANRLELWVLLTRHTTNKHHPPHFIAMHVMQDDEIAQPSTSRGVISGIKPDKLFLRGTYYDGIHCLTRYQPTSSKMNKIVYLTLVASKQTSVEDREESEVGYTITVFSHHPIEFDKTPSPTLYKNTIDAAFTNKTAGGNYTFPTFMNNPQWRINIQWPGKELGGETLKEKMYLKFFAEGGKDLPLNIKIIWPREGRIEDLMEGDVAADTGTYSYGIAFGEKYLTVGNYLVVVSSFSPAQLGPFSLTIACSHQFEMESIPHEGAGMYQKTLKGSWYGTWAAGAPNFGNYESNPIFEIVVPSLARVKFRLQLTSGSSCLPLNVTLFSRDVDSHRIGRQLISSGTYADSLSGVVTPESTLSPGRYLLVPSTYSPGVKADFIILAWSDITIDCKRHR